MSETLPDVAWHISTRSPDNGGNCVEAGPMLDGSGRVAVRHSKAPDAATIVYTRAEWEAFVSGVKDGDFDLTASMKETEYLLRNPENAAAMRRSMTELERGESGERHLIDPASV